LFGTARSSLTSPTVSGPGVALRLSRSSRNMSARVLVADDSSTMRKIILRSLSAVGVPTAVEAADGEEAINAFKPGDFDLVLTDWNMPRKNGLEVIQEIRAQDKDVTIIMVTTEAEKS